MKPKFYIQDWAGNVLNFEGKMERPFTAIPMTFKTFEDAHEYLALKFVHLNDAEYEETLGEFYVEELQ